MQYFGGALIFMSDLEVFFHFCYIRNVPFTQYDVTIWHLDLSTRVICIGHSFRGKRNVEVRAVSSSCWLCRNMYSSIVALMCCVGVAAASLCCMPPQWEGQGSFLTTVVYNGKPHVSRVCTFHSLSSGRLHSDIFSCMIKPWQLKSVYRLEVYII